MSVFLGNKSKHRTMAGFNPLLVRDGKTMVVQVLTLKIKALFVIFAKIVLDDFCFLMIQDQFVYCREY